MNRLKNVWDLDDLRIVSNFYASVMVSDEVIEKQDFYTALQAKVTRHLNSQSYMTERGLEAEAQHMVSMVDDLVIGRQFLIGWRWEPVTREVQFMGGPHDGRIAEVRNPFQPIWLIEPTESCAVFDTGPGEIRSIGEPRIKYELSGWSALQGMWVFSKTGEER